MVWSAKRRMLCRSLSTVYNAPSASNHHPSHFHEGCSIKVPAGRSWFTSGTHRPLFTADVKRIDVKTSWPTSRPSGAAVADVNPTARHDEYWHFTISATLAARTQFNFLYQSDHIWIAYVYYAISSINYTSTSETANFSITCSRLSLFSSNLWRKHILYALLAQQSRRSYCFSSMCTWPYKDRICDP